MPAAIGNGLLGIIILIIGVLDIIYIIWYIRTVKALKRTMEKLEYRFDIIEREMMYKDKRN